MKTKIEEFEGNAENLALQIKASKMQIIPLKEKVEITENENRELKQAFKRANKTDGMRISTLSATLYGNIILNVMLLIVFTIGNPKAINEMLLLGKSIGIGGFILISDKLHSYYVFANEKICLIFEQSAEITSIYTYITCGVIAILFIGIGGVVAKWLIRKSNHRYYYKNKGYVYVLFKKLISLDIVIILYAIYVTQFERVIFLSAMNSLELWGLITAISLVLWNIGDWVKGFGE